MLVDIHCLRVAKRTLPDDGEIRTQIAADRYSGESNDLEDILRLPTRNNIAMGMGLGLGQKRFRIRRLGFFCYRLSTFYRTFDTSLPSSNIPSLERCSVLLAPC